MSELGSYLVPENAEAWKKRIQKLLYSQKWDSQDLEEYLWQLGERPVQAGEQAGETMLAIWDERVIEKREIMTLIHPFLPRFQAPDFAALRDYLLIVRCHRTGERSLNETAPLYHLRFALAYFWLLFPPPLLARLK